MNAKYLFDFGNKPGISGLYNIDSDIGLFDGNEISQVKQTEFGFQNEEKIGKCIIKTTVEKNHMVYVRSDTFTNMSDKPVTLYKFLSRFTLKSADNDIYTQSSTWTNESDGAWQKLISGIHTSNRGLRLTSGSTPFASIWDNNSERGFAFHILSNCAWEININKMLDSGINCVTVIEMGIASEDMRFNIMPGETVELPKIIFYDFDCKTDMGCFKLHDYFNKKYPRKSLPVIYNTWFLNFEDISYDLAAEQAYKASEVGCEYFVVDAGWFGDGNNWASEVGNWKENLIGGFCGHMNELSELVRKLGMKFGLWLEAERALEKAPAVKQHLEYFFKSQGTYFLDFANKKAREYILDVIIKLIEKYNIEFIKMDFNADCPHDKNHSAFYKYHQGHKIFLQELHRRYPKLYIENCASGGYRMELNSMTMFDGVWFSDNQNPFKGTQIFEETILRLPPSCIEKWCAIISVDGLTPLYVKDKETERLVTVSGATWTEIESVEMGYIKAFATGGPLGITCNLNEISENVFKKLKDYVSEFKQMRDFYKVAVCRPLVVSDSFTVLQYNDESESEIILQAFEKKENQGVITIYPKLNKSEKYIYNGITYTSKSLQNDGIDIEIAHMYAHGEKCSTVILHKSEC